MKYVEVESIEEFGVEDTYDIQMENDPSFVANGIVVHNCGMRKLLRDLSAVSRLTFNDLSAATALFRPGPIDAGLLDAYVAVKQGKREPEYVHPSVKPALEKTYGVIVYQEQVMQVARDLSGFTMTEADLLRKAISKKDGKKMAEMKQQFVEGATAGFVEVELEDGTKKVVHLKSRIKVSEGGESLTIEEIFERGLTPLL